MTQPTPDISYFASANLRHPWRVFGIKQADRRSHMYVIGKTGTGKSTLLKALVSQDVQRGRGLALLDPHGDLVKEVFEQIPADLRHNVLYLDTPAGTWTFNPLAGIAPGQEALAVAELVEVFRKIWSDDWGPRLEHLLRNVLFTLIETPDSTLADIQPLLTDKEHRRTIVSGVKNPEVKEFWQSEFAQYSGPFRAVVIAPLQNKLGAFLTDPTLRAILTAKESSFDLRRVIDDGKTLLVNLARGQIGEGPMMLLGSLIAARIGLAGLARADTPIDERRDFVLYLDEFQNFATLSLATMLAELRKYRIGMVLANQYLGQLDGEIRDAVVGNVGTLVCFRLSAADASYFAREMEPVFDEVDFVNLPNYNMYLKLMIDGEVSRAFSAITLAPAAAPRPS